MEQDLLDTEKLFESYFLRDSTIVESSTMNSEIVLLQSQESENNERKENSGLASNTEIFQIPSKCKKSKKVMEFVGFEKSAEEKAKAILKYKGNFK